jgi:hypothetical protein
MAIHITYGEGGFCENCDPNHPHPFNNIVEQIEVPDEISIDIHPDKKSAMNKLIALGLTEEEIKGLLS